MGSRNSRARKNKGTNVRVKVVALLVSMAALWAFAAFVTVREGLGLLWAGTLDQGAGRPTESLVSALQQERRLSAVYLGGRTSAQRAAMTDQRAATDVAVSTFRESTGAASVRWAASDLLQQRIREESALLDGIGKLRQQIDLGGVDGAGAADGFTGIIDGGFAIFNANAGLDDQNIARDARSLIALTRAQELLSREDALLAGTIAAGRFTRDGYDQFVQLVGAQRFQYNEAAVQLPPADSDRYQDLVRGTDASRLRMLEDTVIGQGRANAPPPVSEADWRGGVDPYFAHIRDLILTAGDELVQRAQPVAVWILVRLVLAAGLGLIAVIASVIVSVTTARALVRQLERLREAAHDLASRRLPGVVERLRQGEAVDVNAEAPPLAFGNDEIGQVGQAFTMVQETAVRVAVEQAELRRGVRDVFLNLARRSQALLHRQLGLLDTMERRTAEADELEDLFRVDHLATRMRRNAENLIVLSGATPGRGWRRPIAVIDVIRGALAEVEDYTRVTMLPIADAAIVGRAVGDIIHLLAELIENAVSFSPPYTTVQVGGAPVANGYAVEIEDRGLGMSEAELAAVNARLADPPDFNLADAARLGLYVVGRLAARHGIRVQLRGSPYGGTAAIVLIPSSLMADTAEAVAPSPSTVDGSGTTGGGLPVRRRQTVDAPRASIEPDPPVPADASPVEPAEATTYTAAGLPWRNRQASLARTPNRTADPAPVDGEDGTDPPGRPPEQVRRIMSAIQAGTRLGRSAAEQSTVEAASSDPVGTQDGTAAPDAEYWPDADHRGGERG